MLTILFVVFVIIVVAILAQTMTEVWWFNQAGYGRVLWTEWGTRAVLFGLAFIAMAGVQWGVAYLAYRTRPVYAPTTATAFDQYRESFEPLRRGVTIVVPIVLGVFAGVAVATQWQTIQLWLHAQPFGERDPQFGVDLSYYVFTLPGWHVVVGLAMTVTIIALLVSAFLQFVYGGIRIHPTLTGRPNVSITRAARRQIALVGAVLFFIIAVQAWLSRYDSLVAAGSVLQGADYTDVKAGIPAKTILVGVAVVVGLLFAISAFWGNWRLPAIGVGLMILTAILVGGVYPKLISQFKVQPNAQELQAPYIQRNIDATRQAFGLKDVDVQQYSATTTAQAGALREDADTTASIRLLDPNIVSPAFRQLQQNKQYYDFASTLSVDKYTVGDTSHDTVIGVRELNLAGLDADQRNWVNEHTVFTHGYGVVAAFGNQVSPDGSPSFFESDIPSIGELSEESVGGEYQARIYFSPMSPQYSIVGGTEGHEGWELDYPDDSAGGQVRTAFPTTTTSAGPSVGNTFARLLYSVRFQSEQILFSDRVTSNSQILYDRDPAERVQKVAPYLTLDGRVYPAVVDGEVVWMIDGYTTTNSYPYSTGQTLDTATQDSLTQSSTSVMALAPERVNYIRNSVKATVNAYDGSVTLYAWDATDPILKAWQSIFPSSLKPMSEISSDLMSHIRYPEDLFKVQRTVLSRYHVTDAADFFTAQDFWQVPKDPTAGAGTAAGTALQPPYYVTLQMPEQEESAFSLTTSFIPGGSSGREILTGFLAADADAGNVAGVASEGYGKLRLLVLPRNSTVPGPGQVQNAFNTDPDVAQASTFLKQGNSTVRQGNLLTLPVGGGLLYVQPVYAQSSQNTQYPLLRYVVVAFGDKIGFATTLSAALDEVFGGDSGAETVENDGATGMDDTDVTPSPPGDDTTEPGTTTPPADEGTEPGDGTTEPGDGGTQEPGNGDTTSADAKLATALQDMKKALVDGDAALQKSDFAAYGTAQQDLQDALDRAIAAQHEIDGAKQN